MKKNNKILVAVSPDADTREKMLRRIAVSLGFAMTPSDAAKIIQRDIYSIDIGNSYFILCSNYTFRGSVLTNQRLYEMAARGMAVVLGVKSLPREYEFICQAYYPSDMGL